MSSFIPMAIGQELSNANYRNQGQSTGLLGGPGAIDGTAQSFYNLADPLDLTGKASSDHALANFFDPGNVLGLNQAANPYGAGGVPGNGAGSAGSSGNLPTLPGVGAPKTYDPSSFGGYANLGAGPFNTMAAQMAGPAYDQVLTPQPKAPSPGSPAAAGRGGGGARAAGGGGNGGTGSLGSPFLNLSFGPTTWTGAPIAWGGNMYGWGNNGQVASARVAPEGNGLTNSMVFQSMTPGGKAQR